MQAGQVRTAWIIGVSLVAGLGLLGYLLSDAAIRFKAFERTVTVKGLAEREYPADRVIWPIQFNEASNDLGKLYAALDEGAGKIRAYLLLHGVHEEEISLSVPLITDKSAQQYGGGPPSPFRYTGVQTVTVLSTKVARMRELMTGLSELGKQGIVLAGDGYQTQTEYLFTRLNEIKPAMIEEATRNAREVAVKFAADSDSDLGKIRKASQGQFVIQPRDSNTPHIKRVRVVSTVEYYLSD
ncbi:SIMPL domain-containing protein [Motiliproteus sediminis]|uniref:SIMPL domain-containing protein n=1 Tax=Motiliproteus sediminis TaxID=1468178 RepID=UPI001AEF6B98|nr:SIMPL domain-containing protein [Motiliproteus sediminis]